MTASTHSYLRRLLWVPGLIALISILPATAETSGCEHLSGVQKTQCERVLDCMSINDREVRQACVAAVERSTLKTPAERDEPVTQEAAPLPARTDSPRPAPSRTAPRQETRESLEARVEELEEQLAGSESAEPPERFSGKITAIFSSVLDRKLLTVDDQYLFESDQASEGRFKVGQTVQMKKSPSLLGSRKWLLTGPVGRSVDALRIRCERDDLGRSDRTRCDSMLNQ